MIQRATSFLENLLNLTRAIESLVVDLLVSIAPWLAPLSSAYLVYKSLTEELLYPVWVALATAASVEVLGLGAVSTAMQFQSYNQDTSKSAPKAPILLAILTGILYLCVTGALVLVLDPTAPTEHKITKGVLLLLSILAASIISLRAAHTKRVREYAQQRAAIREERRAAKQAQGAGAMAAPFGIIQAPAKINGNGHGQPLPVGHGGGAA